MLSRPRAAVCSLVFSLAAVAACRPGDPAENAVTTLPPEAMVGASEVATGQTISLDGSRTVLPLSQAMVDAFLSQNPKLGIDLQGTGTGAGLRRFCEGDLDIAAASRPINAHEAEACATQHVTYIELPIGFDSLSVVVSAKNDFVDCVTPSELKTMWEPAAAGKIKRWNQIRAGFPDTPLGLFGPGKDSGTFDYFTLAIVGAESSSRDDYQRMPDNDAIEQAVAKDPNAIGFFGYAYYLRNREQLKALAIDAGQGCVRPSATSVADGSYQPLSRPMFLYVNRASAGRNEVKQFTRFYLAPENTKYLEQLGYAPLPTAALLAGGARFEHGKTGSAMGAHGSVIGVKASDFENHEERVRSALVQ